jgi:hypothetical protein
MEVRNRAVEMKRVRMKTATSGDGAADACVNFAPGEFIGAGCTGQLSRGKDRCLTSLEMEGGVQRVFR